MRYILTSTTVLSIALAAIGQPVSAAGVLTANQIFQRSQKAYDSVTTFDETVRSSVNGGIGGTAHIRFQRPGKLRVSGTTLFNSSKYDLVSNGATWLNNSGTWEKAKNAEMGIASITGISGTSGTTVPALLLHTNWGTPYQAFGHTNAAVATENVNGHSTYRISTRTPLPRTVWIDKKTFFLVKLEQTLGTYVNVLNFNNPIVNRPIPAKAFAK